MNRSDGRWLELFAAVVHRSSKSCNIGNKISKSLHKFKSDLSSVRPVGGFSPQMAFVV